MNLHAHIHDAHYRLTLAQSSADYAGLKHGEVSRSLQELSYAVNRAYAVLRDLDRRLDQGAEDADYSRESRGRLAAVHEALNLAKRQLHSAEISTGNAASAHLHFVRSAKLSTAPIDHK